MENIGKYWKILEKRLGKNELEGRGQRGVGGQYSRQHHLAEPVTKQDKTFIYYCTNTTNFGAHALAKA